MILPGLNWLRVSSLILLNPTTFRMMMLHVKSGATVLLSNLTTGPAFEFYLLNLWLHNILSTRTFTQLIYMSPPK